MRYTNYMRRPADVLVCKGPCGLEKPRDSFYKRRKDSEYRQSWCLECCKSPEYKARRHSSYVRNRESLLSKQADRQHTKKQSYLEYQKIYRDSHVEERTAYRKSAEGAKIYADHAAARRALKQEGFVENVDRLTVFERDKWTCQICLKSVDSSVKWPDLMSTELDHIVPLTKGGTHEYANCQLTHKVCNIKKGNR